MQQTLLQNFQNLLQFVFLPVKKIPFTHDPELEDGRYQILGDAFEVPINDYVANVLPNEIARGEPLQARRAQAVAIRNYIWHRAVYGAELPSHPCFDKNQIS